MNSKMVQERVEQTLNLPVAHARLLVSVALQADKAVAESLDSLLPPDVFLTLAVLYGNALRVVNETVNDTEGVDEQTRELAQRTGMQMHDLVQALRAPMTLEEREASRPKMPSILDILGGMPR